MKCSDIIVHSGPSISESETTASKKTTASFSIDHEVISRIPATYQLHLLDRSYSEKRVRRLSRMRHTLFV